MRELKAFDKLMAFLNSGTWMKRFPGCKIEVIAAASDKRVVEVTYRFITVGIREVNLMVVEFIYLSSSNSITTQMETFFSENDLGFYVITEIDQLIALPYKEHPLSVFQRNKLSISTVRDGASSLVKKEANLLDGKGDVCLFRLLYKSSIPDIFPVHYRYEMIAKGTDCRIIKIQMKYHTDDATVIIGNKCISSKHEMEDYFGQLEILREKEKEDLEQVKHWIQPYIDKKVPINRKPYELQIYVGEKMIRLQLDYCEMTGRKQVFLKEGMNAPVPFPLEWHAEDQIFLKSIPLIRTIRNAFRNERFESRLGQ